MSFVITVHVDGACAVNKSKAGGWAAVINHGERVIAGYEFDTTNNRMELTAIKAALANTPRGSTIEIRSDSEWAVRSITGEYKAKENVDLIEEVRALAAEHRNVKYVNIPRNSEKSHERADRLSKQQVSLAEKELKARGNEPVGALDS